MAAEFGQPLGQGEPWPAPAKLNLCLHIVGRRADGYHLLQTAFQFIDRCDTLKFYRRSPGIIERLAGPAEVPPDGDLVLRAARVLAGTRQPPCGVAIELQKNIPLQAGLGGGSSDAATALVALNELWDLSLTNEELQSLGVRLGADVPVFIGARSAWAEGVGEQLTPCDFPELEYFVIKPPVAVSTAEIFQASELTRNSPLTTIRAFLEQGGRNDCTPTVRSRYPAVAEALDWLQVYGEARLTGTGACVFAGWAETGIAARVAARLPAGWMGFVAKGLNRSPLAARLDQERA